MRKTTDSRKPGFTLIELGIVMAIIGILISLILVAGADGVRRAEERQTQALIIKLETALSERIDALMTAPGPINQTHRYLAAITYADGSNFDPINASVDRRAQVIAQFDYMKAEMPDVFYVSGLDSQYPLNFAMPPYPLTNTPTRDNFALPLGNRQPGLPYTTTNPGSVIPTYIPTPGFAVSGAYAGYNAVGVATANIPTGLVVVPDSGIYGASFTAMGALTKNLYESAANTVIANLGLASNQTQIVAKLGYDAIDNDGDGYIDNIGEVTPGGTYATQFQAQVGSQLTNHDHKTARAEMLYALLVEGQGPLGSAFNPSDFTNRDVADTDGDGMPEFIDAWRQPLQFFRWPIFYGSATVSVSPSDSQQGFQFYFPGQRRQLDPLDPNQLSTSVAWWGPTNTAFPSMVATAPVPNFSASLSVNGPLGTYFHINIDPNTTNNAGGQMWDRTGLYRRRSYYSKFLVLSGGPDLEPGVFQLNKSYQDIDSSYSTAVSFPTGNTVIDATLINWCEGQAAQVEFNGRAGTFLEQVYSPNNVVSSPTSLYLQTIAGLDDISNHALSAPGTGAK